MITNAVICYDCIHTVGYDGAGYEAEGDDMSEILPMAHIRSDEVLDSTKEERDSNVDLFTVCQRASVCCSSCGLLLSTLILRQVAFNSIRGGRLRKGGTLIVQNNELLFAYFLLRYFSACDSFACRFGNDVAAVSEIRNVLGE